MKKRSEWDLAVTQGICPECSERVARGGKHKSDCRKFWFEYGYRVGYHDGANDIERVDHAFLVELIERDEVDNDE